MTQAWNLSQLGNKVNTSGQLDAATGLSGVAPVANGGTNNGSLAVTAGGVLYTNGSQVVNVGAGTAGQGLLSNGASAPSWGSINAGGALNNIRYFTTAGTSTYTPTAGTSFVVVEVVGGGGGGSGTGLGGSGGAGGTSSFGALVSATGGSGGVSRTISGTVTGGVGSSGDLNLTGGTGLVISNDISIGGSSFYAGQAMIAGTTTTPVAGLNYGGGGTGDVANTAAGNGGGGGGYARKTITSAFSGVTITVGAGGTASGSPAGGVGAPGIVIVYEYK